MSTFDLLEKRHHVRKYLDKVPPKKDIEFALWQAWKTTPSKNNAMAYKVVVYGPEHKEQKEKIWQLCVSNHSKSETKALLRGDAITTEKGKPNPYYEHIKLNPYLFVLHSQVREPNEWYKRAVKYGMHFDQAFPERVERIVDSISIDAGMFIQNLTNYLLEQKSVVSYTSCFERNIKEWHKLGLKAAEYRPLILMTAGYTETYRRDYIRLTEPKFFAKDIKPEYEEIIEWI